MNNMKTLSDGGQQGYGVGKLRQEADASLEQSPGSLKQLVGRMNCLSIQFNGVEILGATVTTERPKNTGEMNMLLRELIAMSEAPDVADPEVLGRYSPNDTSSGGPI